MLLGVTGSGKTFTLANVIARLSRPALVISPNKTLAAQLYSEFKSFFPDNAVEYFVSYYDYYQPEAYIPQSDTYIEKDALVNDEIDRMRHSATTSLFERRDVVVVASVSCIYGIGAPETYQGMHVALEVGPDDGPGRPDPRRWWPSSTSATTTTSAAGPSGCAATWSRSSRRPRSRRRSAWSSGATRVERLIDPRSAARGDDRRRSPDARIYPASHYVTPADAARAGARGHHATSCGERLGFFRARGRLLEAQRLEQRTLFDMEMLREIGYCHGVENYSRHLSGRKPGQNPPTLMDYLPEGRARHHRRVATSPCRRSAACTRATARARRRSSSTASACRRRSTTGRSPSRSSRRSSPQTLYVSATPGPYELDLAGGRRAAPGRPWEGGAVAEQIIRPTGLMDPKITVRPAGVQVDDLMAEVRARAERDERVLITTLTKRMAEDLTEYYQQNGLRVRYLHSDIDTLERVAVIRDLRLGKFDAPHRHQPAARGPRPARGLARGHPRRRQGGLPALRDLAHPDRRPRRPPRQRRGASCTRTR